MAKSEVSLSSRLHTQLGQIIARTGPGERLPTEPKLAQQLGVSRATLREAMRTFETQGRIQRRQGVGTFVVHPSSVLDTGLELLESIESMAQRAGLKVRMGSYEITGRACDDDERKLFNLSNAHEICRVIEAEGRPIAYLIDVLPESLITKIELEGEFTGSVLDMLIKRGKPRVVSSDTEINATAAEQNVARALHIQKGDVVLHLRSVLYSMDGKPLARTQSYFLPGFFRFHIIRRVAA
jgi:GntR family transcriptional regulator